MNETWRSEAAKRFPDLQGILMEADSPYEFWTELWLEFENAYDSGKLDRIAEIYGYARWCSSQPRGKTASDDLPTCVSTCFIEHIPEHPKALLDMPHWWSIEEVRRLKDIFSYHVGESGYARILNQFGI
jgi:hypothetical protein